MIDLDKNKSYLEKHRPIKTIEDGIFCLPEEPKKLTLEEAMKKLLKGEPFSVFGNLKEKAGYTVITSNVVSFMATAEGILVTTESGSLYEVHLMGW